MACKAIPTFVPGHRLNSGPFGTKGVGLPFAVGAKIAKPSVMTHFEICGVMRSDLRAARA